MKRICAAMLACAALFCLTACTAKPAQPASAGRPTPQTLLFETITAENSTFGDEYHAAQFLAIPETSEQQFVANYLLAMSEGKISLKSYMLGESFALQKLGHSMYKTFTVQELTTLTDAEIRAEYLYNEPLVRSSLMPLAGGFDAYCKEQQLKEPKMVRAVYQFTYTEEGKGIPHLRTEGTYTMYLLLGQNTEGEYRLADTSAKLLNFTPGKQTPPKPEISILPQANNAAEQQIIDYYSGMANKSDASGYPIYKSFSLDEVRELKPQDIGKERYFSQDLDVAPIFGEKGITYSQFCEQQGVPNAVLIKAVYTCAYTDKSL
nr:hypothetical protein [Oscillospiraceae bacterium]